MSHFHCDAPLAARLLVGVRLIQELRRGSRRQKERSDGPLWVELTLGRARRSAYEKATKEI